MSSKYIDTPTYATSGYTLSGVFQSITIGSAGSIGGSGLTSGSRQAYTIVNRGQITSDGIGIYLKDGGVVTNSVGGLIKGGSGVLDNVAGAIGNSGTIIGTSAVGVYLHSGGVTNTAGALIQGNLIGLYDGGGTVMNAGTIEATGTNSGSSSKKFIGISLSGSNVVTNSGTASLIEGYQAIFAFGYGHGGANLTVTNAGTIISTGTNQYGIYLRSNSSLGHSVIANSSHAFIQGGLYVGGTVTVVNGGTINGGGALNGPSGIHILDGNVTNGASGLIEGGNGVDGNINASIINSGTIIGVAIAVDFGSGLLTNNAGALIEGITGVNLFGAGTVDNVGTVDNFGTIESSFGAGSIAVKFGSAKDVLIDNAGSVFIGKANGGGGTLRLAGKAGTLSGLGTSFYGFGSVDVLAGAAWTLRGASIVASGTTSSLLDNGTLTLLGTSTIAGTVAGTGTLVLDNRESLKAGTALTVAHVIEAGGTATLGVNLAYARSFQERAGTVALGGATLSLTGAAAFSGGAVAGTGLLATHGGVSLHGLTLASGAIWQDYGTVTDTGSLTLGNSGGGAVRLAIEAGGAFLITGNGGAIRTGGSGGIANGGLLEKSAGTGLSTIAPAIANSGTIKALVGTLDLSGAISGTGKLSVGTTGTLKFDDTVASTETVSFAGTLGGALVLNDPAGTGLGFAGKISGFGGKDTLDLATFAFSGGPTVGWTQNGAGGTLTVKDGSKLAKILLMGQYAAAGFKTKTNGASGTLITYTPPPAQVTLAKPHH